MANWKYKIDIKKYIGKDKLSVQEVAKGVLTEVKPLAQRKAFKEDKELSQIIEEFQGIVYSKAATDDEFDEILDCFYDWADDNLVWCGL
jgi:hypothetical protein